MNILCKAFSNRKLTWLAYISISLACSLLPSAGQLAGGIEPSTQNKKVDEKWRWQYKIDGANYDKNEIQTGLLNTLDSTNTSLKLKWLYAIQAARCERFFQSNNVTKLIQKFQTERDLETRRAIFNTIRNSRDKRFVELCALSQNDSDSHISKIASGVLFPGPSLTFYDPNAKEIEVDGVKYDLPKAQVELFSALDSTNVKLKRKWLHTVAKFRTDLQPSVIPRLIRAFQTETDVEVKMDILYAIDASRDPKLIEVCLSVQNDPHAPVRLLAGAFLIEQKQIQGVEMITRCLPELDERGRQNAMQSLGQAVKKFGFDFKPAPTIKAQVPTPAELQVVVAEWTKWWDENKQRYNLPK